MSKERGEVTLDKNLLLYGSADIIGTLILIIVFFVRYGLRHKTEVNYDYLGELPSDMHPAEVNAYLKHSVPDSDAFTASILNLSRRGHIQFETILGKAGILKKGKTIINIKIINKEEEDLKAYEKGLLEFMKEVYASGNDLKEYCLQNSLQAYEFFYKWKEQVKESVNENYEYYYEIAPWGVKAALISISALNMLWAAISCINRQFQVFEFAIPVIVISICSIGMLKRKSQKGVNEEQSWKAFKRFLKNFSKLDRHDLPEISKWEEYLVYASALGAANQVLKQLTDVYPEVKQEYYGSWFNYFGYMYGESNTIESMSTLKTFIKALSEMVDDAFNISKVSDK